MADVTARKRNDKWEYRIELASIDGKRQQKSKSGFKTKAEALKAGRAALKEYENCGQIIEVSEISVADMLNQWITEMSSTDLQETTVEGYRKKIRLYIEPSIGAYKAKNITRQTIQQLITDLANQGLSRNTVSSVRGILTSAFDWAEFNKMISYNPAFRIKIPRITAVKSRTEPHVYLPKECMDKIFERFTEGNPGYLPLMLGYHCGLRLGETYALCWSDIDLENKVLYVNKQVQWHQDRTRTKEDKEKANGSKSSGNGYWYFTTPKFDSYRAIDLDDTICAILLKEQKKQQKARAYYEELYTYYYSSEDLNEHIYENKITEGVSEHKVDFLLRRENGQWTSPRTMMHVSSVIHHQLEMPEFDYHSLRHTHATELRTNGAPDIYIQRRLGHVKVETTTQIYANHITDKDSAAGNQVLKSIF